MLKIRGQYAEAVCYAKIIEDEAVEQIRRMCDTPIAEGAKVRIMPDVHAGVGCTIGTTMTVVDKACPNIVGVDIGCGMYTIRLKEKTIDFAAVDEAAHYVPSGLHTWDQPAEPFDLTGLICWKHLKEKEWLSCSLGTLGGGNHFIEIDRAADGTFYLIVHSGSRNLGKQVANWYQRVAVDQQRGMDCLEQQRGELIQSLLSQGRQEEIQQALKNLSREYDAREPDLPKELCWLSGQHLQDYLHDVEICQRFARRSREILAQTILTRAGLTAEDAFHTIHNYINTDEMILRKGAIAAHQGEKVLIPINMRDGSVLAVGKGNPEWNFSAPHGAGRLMSRAKAKATIDMEAYRQAMAGIYSTSVSEQTLDESPMAYKSLSDIVDVIGDTVDIIDVMKPVYNFKAAEEEAPPWKNKADQGAD